MAAMGAPSHHAVNVGYTQAWPTVLFIVDFNMVFQLFLGLSYVVLKKCSHKLLYMINMILSHSIYSYDFYIIYIYILGINTVFHYVQRSLYLKLQEYKKYLYMRGFYKYQFYFSKIILFSI